MRKTTKRKVAPKVSAPRRLQSSLTAAPKTSKFGVAKISDIPAPVSSVILIAPSTKAGTDPALATPGTPSEFLSPEVLSGATPPLAGKSEAQPMPTIKRAEEQKINPIAKITTDFEQNIAALRHFTENIGPLADAQDEKNILGMIQAFEKIFALKSDKKGGTFTIYPEGQSNPGKLLRVSDDDGKKILEQHLNQIIKAPTFIDKILRHKETHNSAAFQSGDVLRRSSLLTLITYSDVLVAQLVRTYYKAFPAALPASTPQLSLAELRLLGSVDAAEEHVLDNFVDGLLRNSLNAQLDFFADKLKIDLKAIAEFKDRILETVQRRHILVHNGGIVNRTYLDRVSGSLVEEYKIKIGDKIAVDDTYLRRAIDRVRLLGVVLLQRCWRKWFKDDLSEADTAINDAIYVAVSEERYKLACHLGEFGCTLKFGDDISHRMMLLNLAQAYKWDGHPDKALQTVAKADWSSCRLRLQLGLSAIRDEATEFFRLLPRAIAGQEVSRDDLVKWPIFKELRKDARYVPMLNSLLPEDVTPITSSLEKNVDQRSAVESPKNEGQQQPN